MVYDGVHNPAAQRCYTGSCSCGCADRADSNTNTKSAIHTGGNRFEYGFNYTGANFGNSYSHADSTIHTGGNR